MTEKITLTSEDRQVVASIDEYGLTISSCPGYIDEEQVFHRSGDITFVAVPMPEHFLQTLAEWMKTVVEIHAEA